tara:strand:- start:494 stop:913 length:420 start_codon:yes stop_codon:yes gene_type:complete
MKNVLLTIAIILTSILGTNAQEETFNLTVNISGLESDNGKVMIALYNDAEQFLSKRYKSAMIKSTDKKVTYIFEGVPKGEYAVSFFHDENDNNKMDTNFIGIPKEDYGCSNNATGFMGPPKYEDAKFIIEEHKSINIEI